MVFEHTGIERHFRDEVGNFDSVRQNAVAAHYRTLIDHDARSLGELFVIFTEFEPLARWEANSAITSRMPAIQEAIADSRLWTIHQQFEGATVMLHTEAQLERFTSLDRRRYQDAYMAALLPHDEFGYFRTHPIELAFDSRERFDRDFQSSWYFYNR